MYSSPLKRYFPRGPEGLEMVEDPLGAYVHVVDHEERERKLLLDIEALVVERDYLTQALRQIGSAILVAADQIRPMMGSEWDDR